MWKGSEHIRGSAGRVLRRIRSKVARNYRDYGLRTTLIKVAQGGLSFLFLDRTYRIYRARLDGAERIPFEPDRDLVWRLLEPGDSGLISQMEEMEEWLHGRVAAVLGNGGICVAAVDGDRLAGFNLISFGKVYMPLVRLWRDFRADEAWSEQITVGNDYRNRGIATALRVMAFRELRKRGISKFYGGTLPSNRANIRLCRKTGFVMIADIRYRKLGPLQGWKFIRVGEGRDA